MDRSVVIAAFGRFSVLAGGEDRTAAFSPRARRCLAHLALREEAIDRNRLAAELWPDASEPEAMGSLRRRLHELQCALVTAGVSDGVARTRDKVGLAPRVQWSIDVTRYAILARDPNQARRAASLYEEPIFPGLDDDLLDRERRRLRATQIELLTHLLDLAIRRGDAVEIAGFADAILRLDVLSEQTIARAVESLNALGEADRGRRLSQRFGDAMREEVEAEPAALDAGSAAMPEESMQRVLQPLVDRGAELRGPAAARYFDELQQQIGEISEALNAAIVRQCDVELGVRALAALSRFFFDRGHTVEAYRWYEAAIPRLHKPSALRSEALYLQAMVGRNLGSPEHNLPAFEQAIEELRESGDRTTLAKAMLYGSNAARMTGRLQPAEDLATQALAILQECGDAYLVAFATSALGAAAYAQGHLGVAREHFEHARAAFAELGARDDEALMLVNLGRCAFAQGEIATMYECSMQALGRASGSRNVYIEAHAHIGLTLLALDRGDARGACGHAARASEISMSISDVELSVIALEAVAEIFLALGEFGRARDALAAADGMRSEYLIGRAPTEHARCERVRAELALRGLLIRANVGAPDVMMRSLLASVARSYHHIL